MQRIGIGFYSRHPGQRYLRRLNPRHSHQLRQTTQHPSYKEDADTLVALTSNPVNLKALDDLKVLFGKRVRPLITTTSRVQDAINKVYEKSTANLSGLDEIEEEDYDLDDPIVDLLEAGEDDAPVIKMVNSLLFRAVKRKSVGYSYRAL